MSNNVWRWQAKDGKGNAVDAAPGQPFFESRGPTTKAAMQKAADLILYNKRLDAIR